MSHKATNWAINQRGLAPAAKIVLWHLCDRHNPDFGCFPSQDRLAHDCEMSRASVNRHLGELEEKGLIARQVRRDEANRQLPTMYKFAFEEGFEPSSRVSNCDTEIEPEPCLKSDESRVSNPHDSVSHRRDTNLVREPIREPLSAQARSEQEPAGGEKEDLERDEKKRIEAAFKRFAPDWPTYVSDSEPAARAEWFKLSQHDREQAAELAPAYLAAERAAKRTTTCALAVYLRERRWQKLPAQPSASEQDAAAARAVLPQYGKDWMAARLHLLQLPREPWRPTAMAQRLLNEGKAELVKHQRIRAQFPKVMEMDALAVKNAGYRLPPNVRPPSGESFVRIARGSAEWKAWERWHVEQEMPWIDPPAHVQFVFMPSSLPPAPAENVTRAAAGI
jgi:DNA-binding transcriptional ArsR family regulator